jgi:hypothetical protein
VQHLGSTNKAVLTALYNGICALPRQKIADFFSKAGYDAPDTDHDLLCPTLVTLVTTAAAAAATALLVLKYNLYCTNVEHQLMKHLRYKRCVTNVCNEIDGFYVIVSSRQGRTAWSKKMFGSISLNVLIDLLTTTYLPFLLSCTQGRHGSARTCSLHCTLTPAAGDARSA